MDLKFKGFQGVISEVQELNVDQEEKSSRSELQRKAKACL